MGKGQLHIYDVIRRPVITESRTRWPTRATSTCSRSNSAEQGADQGSAEKILT